MTRPLDVLAVEPWLGGSHRRFLESWRARSRHRVAIRGLRARHWKWRMQGAAHSLARTVAREGVGRPDVILASDYLDLPRFRGFLPPDWAGVPAVLYLHENQLTYPAAPGAEPDERDHAYAFTNVLSLVAAEVAVFNSRFHRDELGAAARELIGRLPRPRPTEELERALRGARVVGPGVELGEIPLGRGAPAGAPLRVAYNHRWEHDKDPVAFLRAVLDARRETGRPIDVVLLGERAGEEPAEAEGLVSELRGAGAVRHVGYAPDRRAYAELLGECDVVVSTARHEFFGISVAEAVAAGCRPLAPRRLAYPEVLADVGPDALYESPGGLVRGLAAAAANPRPFREAVTRAARRDAMERHDATVTAAELDAIVEEVGTVE